MQAIRQCSACASRVAGGYLRNWTEVSLLQTNKNGLKSGAACVRFLSGSDHGTLSRRRPVVQKMGESTETVHMCRAPFSVGRGLCAFPSAQQVEYLSHDSLIRRAASVVTDSSSTFLSQATLALIDALTNYSKAVLTRIAVQRRYLASVGKLTPAEEDSLLQLINSHRALASDRLSECKRFESTWVNAVNMCQMAAEAAHTSGAEQASVTVRTNVQLAQAQVEDARKLSMDADRKLAETKVEEIQRMAEYAAFRDGSEEHELHEAYLRED
ncbi:uncharacterized protein V6R79_023513 [Siganus canaliculatus]